MVAIAAPLQARLAKLKDAGTGELREKAELQEALVRSEEQRLEVSRALIDFQVGDRLNMNRAILSGVGE